MSQKSVFPDSGLREETRLSDEQIIELYFRRDEEAVRLTDRFYGGDVFRLSYRILESREDAEENRNDTWMRTWQSIPPVRPRFFPAWLLKICRNLALGRLEFRNAKKRNAAIVELTDEMEACIPDNRLEEQAAEAELEGIINAFLKTLPKEQRNILLRRCFLMEPVSEIARSFGYSEGKVSTILWRAKGKLKTYLEKEGIPV